MAKKGASFADSKENLYRSFSLYEGTLYVLDLCTYAAVRWDGKEWVEADGENLPEPRTYPNPEEASQYADFPPWDALDAIAEKRLNEERDYWEGLIQKAPNHVLGFVAAPFGTDSFLSMQAVDLGDEEYASLIRLYREKGYFYSGETYQESEEAVTPVMDNYRYLDFSRRGFGGLIARVRGDYSLLGYAAYSDGGRIEGDEVLPKQGRVSEVKIGSKRIAIGEEIHQILRSIQGEFGLKWLFVPVPEDEGFYWPSDVVSLVHGEESYEAEVKGIVNYSCEEEFELHRSHRGLMFLNDPPVYGKPLLMVGTLRPSPFHLGKVEAVNTMVRYAQDEDGKVYAYHLIYNFLGVYDPEEKRWKALLPEPRFMASDPAYFLYAPEGVAITPLSEEEMLSLCDGNGPDEFMIAAFENYFDEDE